MPDVSILSIFATSFLVGLSGAVSPGPLLAFNIRQTVRRNFLAGPYVAAGHSILELAVVTALALGLTQWLDSDPAMAAIGILGGLFLLWMGWGMLRDPGRDAPGATECRHPITQRYVRESVVGGILVSLSNPYWAIWWMTAGVALMAQSIKLGLLGISTFYFGHILSDFVWYSLVSAALLSSKRFITQRLYRGIMLSCGALLAAIGTYFVFTGVRVLA